MKASSGGGYYVQKKEKIMKNVNEQYMVIRWVDPWPTNAYLETGCSDLYKEQMQNNCSRFLP